MTQAVGLVGNCVLRISAEAREVGAVLSALGA